LGQKFVYGTGMFFVSDHGLEVKAMVEQLEILRNMHELEKLMAKDTLKEYQERIDLLIEALPVDRAQILDFFYQLLHWVVSSINIHGDNGTTVIFYSHQISQCDTLEGMMLLFKKFITNIIENAQKNKAISREISQAMSYIKSNYGMDINLQEVANHVNLNPTYLSNLFKKDLQINFTEFLNEVRIQKAKELLVDSYLKAYEISEKVGFADNTYFCRVFKKLTGSSPNEYRKQWVRGWKEVNDE